MQVPTTIEADAARISRLIRSLSGPFLVSPDGSGAERFLESITEQAISGYISAGNFQCLIAETENHLVGVVALRDNIGMKATLFFSTSGPPGMKPKRS